MSIGVQLQAVKNRLFSCCAALALFVLATPAALPQSTPLPMNRAEILGRLALGQHPSVLASLVKTRGISFSPDASFLSLVAAAGGHGILYDRIFSSSQTSSSADADSDPPFALLAKCAELLHSGETDQAEAPCRSAIDENPRSPWAILAVLRAIRGNEQTPDRLELARRAVQLTPSLPFAHANLARALPQGPEQSSELNLSFSRDPEDLTLADRYYYVPFDFLTPQRQPQLTAPETQRLEEAIRETRTLDMELASTHLRLANLEFTLGRTEQGLSDLREAIRLEPDVPSLHQAMAQYFLGSDQDEAALAEFREAIRCEPRGLMPHMQLIGAFWKLDRHSEALDELRSFVSSNPTNAEASQGLVEASLEINDRPSAISELRRFLQAFSALPSTPSRDDVRFSRTYRLANLLQENAEFEASASVYLDALRMKPDSAEVHNDYGNTLLSLQKNDEAAEQFQEALRIDPSMSAAHNNLGLCFARHAKLDAAIAEYRKALELNPSEPHTAVSIGLALAEKGDFAGAIAHYKAMLAQSRDNTINASDPEEEIERRARQAVEESEGQPVAVEYDADDVATAENNLAWIYATAPQRTERNPQEALIHAKRAIELLSQVPSAKPQEMAAFLDTLAEAQLVNGQAKEALATEEKAQAKFPDNPELKSRLEHFRNAATNRSALNHTP